MPGAFVTKLRSMLERVINCDVALESGDPEYDSFVQHIKELATGIDESTNPQSAAMLVAEAGVLVNVEGALAALVTSAMEGQYDDPDQCPL